MRDGYAAAQTAVNDGLIVVSDNGDDFVGVVCGLHSRIFAATGLPFAGSVRAVGEPDVQVDRGEHAFEGAPADEINDRLKALHTDLVNSREAKSRHDVARRCAALFEHFFEIHPFHDGNGRVARLIAMAVAQESETFEFGPFPENRANRVRYLNSLRYAHKTRRVRRDGGRDWPDRADPLRFLTRWLERLLVEQQADADLSENPPEWLRVLEDALQALMEANKTLDPQKFSEAMINLGRARDVVGAFLKKNT